MNQNKIKMKNFEIRSHFVEIRSHFVEIRAQFVEIWSYVVEIWSYVVEIRAHVVEIWSHFVEIWSHFVEIFSSSLFIFQMLKIIGKFHDVFVSVICLALILLRFWIIHWKRFSWEIRVAVWKIEWKGLLCRSFQTGNLDGHSPPMMCQLFPPFLTLKLDTLLIRP